ncbi:Brp/Blh family beta-carotene 15,15'-dioxygenase [Arcicella aquatica]|uniref:Probable beta-carotene 15,15'-dioxygenase n=1 Tax=Arcicella aquatica TaxID=217141 RepID=A0ABU5QQH9_9BACT|nr:Brp/Blh family beta-carotene 15,15'-dioxygenase [Arcicella aquatica]MEA5259130.1 Brp/Blh family beta-carotene 15,15'-dioxygenase [Arcicella aquatica]
MQLFNRLQKNPTWLTILLGFILLIWQFFVVTLPQNVQIIFFVSLILLTGIPHGALDHLIQEATYKKLNKKYNFKRFLLKYILIMLVYGVVWYWFSGLSLLIFLIISAWHFGETDLEKAPKNVLIWSFTRLIYGFYILSFILLTNVNEVEPIIIKMVGNQSYFMICWNFIVLNVRQILYLLGLSFTTIFIIAQSKYLISFDKLRIVRLCLILFLSAWLPLFPAFALYFGGWHALCAFDNILEYLQKDYPTLSFKLIYLKTLPFTLLAIASLCAFLWYCNAYFASFDPFPILFIFISLITLPHLIVTHQMKNDTE